MQYYTGQCWSVINIHKYCLHTYTAAAIYCSSQYFMKQPANDVYMAVYYWNFRCTSQLSLLINLSVFYCRCCILWMCHLFTGCTMLIETYVLSRFTGWVWPPPVAPGDCNCIVFQERLVLFSRVFLIKYGMLYMYGSIRVTGLSDSSRDVMQTSTTWHMVSMAISANIGLAAMTSCSPARVNRTSVSCTLSSVTSPVACRLICRVVVSA